MAQKTVQKDDRGAGTGLPEADGVRSGGDAVQLRQRHTASVAGHERQVNPESRPRIARWSVLALRLAMSFPAPRRP